MTEDGDGINTLSVEQFSSLITNGQALTDRAIDLRMAQTPDQITRAMHDVLLQAHVLGQTMNLPLAASLPELMWTWQSTAPEAGTQQQFEEARDRIAASVHHLAATAMTATVSAPIPVTQAILNDQLFDLATTAQGWHQGLQPAPPAPETDPDGSGPAQSGDDGPDGPTEF
jgi:hypothetical protein